MFFLAFHAREFTRIRFCSWEPRVESIVSFVAETCAVVLQSEERGFPVSKHLSFLLLRIIMSAFLFSFEKGCSSRTGLCQYFQTKEPALVIVPLGFSSE